jgi:uncharacterized membrane protein
MKTLFAGTLVVMLAILAGCSQGTPGGPGTTDKDSEKPMYGQQDNTFNLSVPRTSTSLQQGEELETTVGIKRAKNFDQDVTLKFTDVPKGVTVEPASPMIHSSDKESKITFKAGDEAPVGDYKVQVTGHPGKGGDAQIEFKLTILPKDSFTLSMPDSTTLKQGEEQTVLVGIKRDETFDQDVELKFGELPKGVTLQPEAPLIKQGSTEAQVAITASKDASLGDFGIKVTGHPLKGAEASNEFKLTVVKSDIE